MLTFNEATKIYYINKEIKAIQLDLAELEECRVFSKAITYSDMPKGNTKDPTEDIDDYFMKKQELIDMLNYSLKKLQQERLKMEKFLANINDAEMRLIIRLRCVNNMSWREIGKEIGMERSWVSRKFFHFFEKSTKNTSDM